MTDSFDEMTKCCGDCDCDCENQSDDKTDAGCRCTKDAAANAHTGGHFGCAEDSVAHGDSGCTCGCGEEGSGTSKGAGKKKGACCRSGDATEKGCPASRACDALSRFYRNHNTLFWLLAVGLPLLALVIGCIVRPEIFYDQFVWKFYWGPIVADGTGHPVSHNGVVASSGYNVVNTISWAVLMIGILVWLNKIFRRFSIKVDLRFIPGVVVYIVMGAILHVMEDSGMFLAPLKFFLITPLIYLEVAAVALLVLAVGILLGKAHARNRKVALIDWAGILVLANVAYLITYLNMPGQIIFMANPLVLLVASVPGFLMVFFRERKTGGMNPVHVMTAGGVVMLILQVYLVFHWMVIGKWAYTEGTHAWILLPVILGSAAITGAVYGIARALKKKHSGAAAYMMPLNLMMIFAQMTDAIASSMGIDFFPYSEKHVLPKMLIDFFEKLGLSLPATTAMMPFKFLIVMLVIYMIDVASKEEVKMYPNMVGLVKMAIIMLGIGPGIRNVVRLAMGV